MSKVEGSLINLENIAHLSKLSKKRYLTHGIVIATAIIIVSFEILPLTSLIVTINGIQRENSIYANQEYDEHIIAVVTTTGRSIILNLEATLPSIKNNSVNSNFRIQEDILKALEQDAKRRGISINSLVNNALKNYVTSDKYFKELGRKLSTQHNMEIVKGIQEEGAATTTTTTIRTRILENQSEMIKEIKCLNNAANKLSICTKFGGMQMSYIYLYDSYKNVLNKYKTGESKEGMRWLMNIDRDSIDLVRIFLESGIHIRHIKHMPPLNFGVSENEVAITIDNMMGGKMSQSFLISNEPLYVNHFNSLFDQLWKNGINAEDRRGY